MDGIGRATDNAFIERLWRNIKYEKLYIFKPENGLEVYRLCDEYFSYYNYERRHSSIGNLRPAELYYKNNPGMEDMSLPHCNTLKNPFGEDFSSIDSGNLEEIY